MAGTGGGQGGGCDNCLGFDCCDDTCVNMNNDIFNCGKCGDACDGPNPFCDFGVCGEPQCGSGSNDFAPAGSSAPPPVPPDPEPASCCGSQFCGVDQLCCDVPGPVGSQLQLEFKLSGYHFRGFARVLYQRCDGPGSHTSTPAGVGVAFFGSDRNSKRLLREAISELEARYLP